MIYRILLPYTLASINVYSKFLQHPDFDGKLAYMNTWIKLKQRRSMHNAFLNSQ